jgi:hypothetical protein
VVFAVHSARQGWPRRPALPAQVMIHKSTEVIRPCHDSNFTVFNDEHRLSRKSRTGQSNFVLISGLTFESATNRLSSENRISCARMTRPAMDKSSVMTAACRARREYACGVMRCRSGTGLKNLLIWRAKSRWAPLRPCVQGLPSPEQLSCLPSARSPTLSPETPPSHSTSNRARSLCPDLC